MKITKKIMTGVLTLAVSLMLASVASAAKPTKVYCIDLDGDRYGDPNICVDVKHLGTLITPTIATTKILL